MNKNHLDKDEDKDPRVAMVGTIMGTTIAILGVCIPLVAVTKMAYLPLFVIGGAFLASVAVWYSNQNSAVEAHSAQHVEELEKTVADLKERLENVETINHFERAMAEKSMETVEKRENSEVTTVTEPVARETR